MAVLTERAIKHHKVAVILIENLLEDVPKGNHDVEFEWFRTVTAAEEFMDQYTDFAKEDAAEFAVIGAEDPPLAYLTILIPDTETLAAGKFVLAPENAATIAWRDGILADLTMLYTKPEDQSQNTLIAQAGRRSFASRFNADGVEMADVFLLTWNPTNWDGDIEEGFINEVVAGNPVNNDWSTGGTTRAIGPGSKVYLLRQGLEPLGIIASGTVTSKVRRRTHWENSGRYANYVDVHWTEAVTIDSPLPLADLKLHSPQQHWQPQASGTRIRANYAKMIATLWEEHVAE